MKPFCGLVVCLILIGGAMHWLNAEPASPVRPIHARPFATKADPAYFVLPPGAVEPLGWLRDWSLAARDGYTGQMDEVDPAFQQAWRADYQMRGNQLVWHQGAWPYEGGGYWFDGLVRLGFALHDEALLQQAKRRLEAVTQHMTAHSLLFLWWLDRENADDQQAAAAALEGWPLWACGLLGRAMSGRVAGDGDSQTLHALELAYGSDPQCLASLKGSLANLWPAYDTYTWTGNPGVAAAIDALFEPNRSQLKENLARYGKAPPLLAGTEVINQHLVEFLENSTPWSVAYLWTGNRDYLEAALAWHELVAKIAMQPYGVPVGDEWYLPTSPFHGTETCDVAGYLWSQANLLAISGRGQLADRLEKAFFNAAPAAVGRDFKTHVYFQCPNRFADGSPDFPHGPQASGGSYQPKHSPLCCTAALNRILPSFINHMWMATPDNGLAAMAYGPCRVTTLVANRVPVTITAATEYPFNETIELTIVPKTACEFPLLLHLPAWCHAPQIAVNGNKVETQPNADRFARLLRTWQSGDRVVLTFPMQAQVELGHDRAPTGPYNGEHHPTQVTIPDPREAHDVKPFAVISYGPLLMSLAIPDTRDANTPDPLAKWKFALDWQDLQSSVTRSPLATPWNWPLNAPLQIEVNAEPIDWNPDGKQPQLPAAAFAPADKRARITLVPYGCTKFRISMFPVLVERKPRP